MTRNYIINLIKQNEEKYKIDAAGKERRQFLTDLETDFGFTFPSEIKSFYTQFDIVNGEFWRSLVRLSESKSKNNFAVQINSRFAKIVIELYHQLKEAEVENLISELKAFDPSSDFESYILEYLLIDGPNKYDYSSNSFEISILQKAYEKLNFDIDTIKVLHVIWAHCGGWGGLIIRGKNLSFAGGGMHGHHQEVEVNGKLHEYSSNFYEQMEKHLLIDAREFLLKKLKEEA